MRQASEIAVRGKGRGRGSGDGSDDGRTDGDVGEKIEVEEGEEEVGYVKAAALGLLAELLSQDINYHNTHSNNDGGGNGDEGTR